MEARSESFANRSESESNRNNNVQYPTKEDMEKLPAGKSLIGDKQSPLSLSHQRLSQLSNNSL